jgi:long-subunit fatty acid transport protein
MVVGNDIDVKFELPPVTRFGVEVRPTAKLRVELALDIEYWSVHKDMELTTHDVRIENGAGVGEYDLSPLTIPRHYKNSYAPALGAEYDFGPVQVGAGYSYETAAAPKGYVSVLTVDSAKHIIGIGGSWKPRGGRSGWTLGGAFAFVKLTDVDVPLEDAKVPQLTPLRDQPSEVMVNAGSYKSSYVVGGLRLAKKF